MNETNQVFTGTAQRYIRIEHDCQICVCPADEAEGILKELTDAGKPHKWKGVVYLPEHFEALPDFEGWVG